MFAERLRCTCWLPLVLLHKLLWQEPPPLTTSDWGLGSRRQGKRLLSPHIASSKRSLEAPNPKVEVKDERGRRWTVKFGSEGAHGLRFSRDS
jgi:hypothetical protein